MTPPMTNPSTMPVVSTRSTLREERHPNAVTAPPINRGSMTPRPWRGFWNSMGTAALMPFSKTSPKPAADAPQPWQHAAKRRRTIFMLLTLISTALATSLFADMQPDYDNAWLEYGQIVLFALLSGWVVTGFMTAMMGFYVTLRGDPHSLSAKNVQHQPLDAATRTAIIMPICNEDVRTVFAGLRATCESVAIAGHVRAFDVFVLSDSNDAAIIRAERAAWEDLRTQLATQPDQPQIEVYYRLRTRRTDRKAGNVADFCRRWGNDYKYMVVLDADSVMSGDCLVAMVKLMEANPKAGIIQTATQAIGHVTLHARAQQFASRVTGRLFTLGMQYWQMGESHYWGHNAIIRVEPFMQHCALAHISGTGGMSGSIMSHDFVEAALMRRAGFHVWLVADLIGSYEQQPPDLLAELQRDRRWCQGNLQNSKLLLEPGIHAVHRTAFLTGVLAYASSPLWLAFLLLSTFLFARNVGSDPVYFFAPYQLFPSWPTANIRLMLTLFGLTGVLLLAPKAMSLIAIVLRGHAVRFGGAPRLFASAFIEFLHSMLLAPVRMFFHTQFVIASLTGWRLDWKSPPRDDAATRWRQAWGRHGLHTVLAVIWIAAIVVSSSAFPWWLSPILAGLLAAIPLSVWGSRAGVGRALRRRGLLLTPEELRQPRVLAEAGRAADLVAERTATLRGALTDAGEYARTLAALPARPGASGDKGRAAAALLERALAEGPEALGAPALLLLLSDRTAMAGLRDSVAARRAPPGWWSTHPVGSTDQAGAAPEPAVLAHASHR